MGDSSNHKFLEVIDVGQGDCMIMHPPEGCKHDRKTYLIDAGNGMRDFTDRLDGETLCLVLTHSHKDHIQGLQLLNAEMLSHIKEVILPFYQDEISLLARALLSIKGINELPYSDELTGQLEAMVLGQAQLIKLAMQPKVKFIFAHEGMNYCGHWNFMNPPIYEGTNESAYNDETLLKNLPSLFDGRFGDELSRHISMLLQGGHNADTPMLDSYTIQNNRRIDRQYQATNRRLLYAKAEFMLQYFRENYETIAGISNGTEPKSTSASVLYRSAVMAYHKHVHDSCLVFGYQYESNDGRMDDISNYFLFTGDADIRVFERILNHGYNLKCGYLKVPHHGSKNNMNGSILKQMSPHTAILSHGNRRFGRSKDPHPNQKVLDLLNKNHIRILTTHDIKKSGRVILAATSSYDKLIDIIR